MKHAWSTIVALGLAGCGPNLTHPPDRSMYTDDAGTLSCLPNLDGQIDASELQAAIGVQVTYVVSPQGAERTVDLVGAPDNTGQRIWDFSQDFATDQTATIEASSLPGKWYQTSFPSGQWAAPVDAADTIEGVYSEDSEAIYLHGIASKDPSPPEGKTLEVYDQPVAVYRFPIKVGASWTSVGHAENAMIRGLPYAGTDTYVVADVATGQLMLHDFTFTQAHRLTTTVTLAPAAGATQVTRQSSFMFECFGEVTRATSNVGETSDDFTMAAELRRLGQ